MHDLISSKSEYRADIDGIRSLAVLSVFVFHLQPNLLPGGFLGVDVFFVISGYLITGILLGKNHSSNFSFIHFYARRVKRIFPALFVVLLLSGVVATFFLTPDTYANFMSSARYASGQLANFFFSRDVGYFSEGFSGQPLLHTWSLGVEEQFYIFWPLLIYFCFCFFQKSNLFPHGPTQSTEKIANVPEKSISDDDVFARDTYQNIHQKIAGVMLLMSLLSFMVCFFLTEANYNLAFYMFYTRALEFCVGGLISLRLVPGPETKLVGTLLGATGGFLLFYSFLFIKEEYLGISFLQFGVLLPCFGTALIIQANSQKSFANKILATKIPVYIGRISYSLYLYHWPVIIFWKIYSNTDELGVTASISIILVSFALATLSYLFVEQPVRRSTLPDRNVLYIAGSVIIIFAVSFEILEKFETASWRVNSYADKATPLPEHYSSESRKEVKNGIEYYSCSEPSDKAPPIVALVGDSHSPHFLHGTTVWAEKNAYDVAFQALAACPILLGDIRINSVFGEEHDKQCRQQMSRFETQIVDDPRVEIILIAHRFDLFHTGLAFSNKTKPMLTFMEKDGSKVKDHTRYYQAQLEETIETIRNKGKEVIILKQVPIFNGAKDCDWEPLVKRLLHKERACEFDTAFIKKWQQPSINFIDEFTMHHNVTVIDPMPFFKSPLHDGTNLYKDNDHLNEYGKRFMVPYFVSAMDEIMDKKN